MNETEKKTVVGYDGLVEFGQYLESLRVTDYTFEMEDRAGRMEDCSLDDVIEKFRKFVESDSERFRVAISYNDYVAGTMGRTDKEFRRRRKQ